MDSGKHAQQEIVVSNKTQEFLMAGVPMKYGKRQGTMASGNKIRHVK